MQVLLSVGELWRSLVVRIGVVTLLVGMLSAWMAWQAASRDLREEMVEQAAAEVRRIVHELRHRDASTQTLSHRIAEQLRLSWFDAVAVVDHEGRLLARLGVDVLDRSMPATQSGHQWLSLSDGRAALYIATNLETTVNQPWTVHAVRSLSAWEQRQLQQASNQEALLSAAVAGGAALLSGVILFPLLRSLWRDNLAKARGIAASYVATMEALGQAVARRDSDTGAHNYRVAWMASMVGQKMGLDDDAIRSLILGSFLHDVGKIAIPDRILLKPARLDEDEWRIMRTHVEQGEGILAGIPWLRGAVAVVSAHHERWDGRGYPRGLQGEEIPLSARIFAVVDVFDALTSRRPYKEPLPLQQALNMIERDSGTHFDPKVVALFLEIAPELYRQLEGLDEMACRKLLHQRIEHYFGVALFEG